MKPQNLKVDTIVFRIRKFKIVQAMQFLHTYMQTTRTKLKEAEQKRKPDI